MGFKGDRLQAETIWIDVEILIGNEKESVLLSGSQAAKPRKNHEFLGLESLLKASKELRHNLLGRIGINAVRL